MLDILLVIPTFDLCVKPAITLVWADLNYNLAASPLPLWEGVGLVQQAWGLLSHTPAGPAQHGPAITFHVDQGRGVQCRAVTV